MDDEIGNEKEYPSHAVENIHEGTQHFRSFTFKGDGNTVINIKQSLGRAS